jgi:putative endonuclease
MILNLSFKGAISMKQYYVYILTNKTNKVFYIGVTNNLIRRMYEHKNKLLNGFTKKYNLMKLIHFESTNDIQSALEREKQLKNWHRDWKINMINKRNPDWKDLSEEWDD